MQVCQQGMWIFVCHIRQLPLIDLRWKLGQNWWFFDRWLWLQEKIQSPVSGSLVLHVHFILLWFSGNVFVFGLWNKSKMKICLYKTRNRLKLTALLNLIDVRRIEFLLGNNEFSRSQTLASPSVYMCLWENFENFKLITLYFVFKHFYFENGKEMQLN